jgi:hypothetical protein
VKAGLDVSEVQAVTIGKADGVKLSVPLGLPLAPIETVERGEAREVALPQLEGNAAGETSAVLLELLQILCDGEGEG